MSTDSMFEQVLCGEETEAMEDRGAEGMASKDRGGGSTHRGPGDSFLQEGGACKEVGMLAGIRG